MREIRIPDAIPPDIVSFFLLLTAMSMMIYIATDIRSPFGRRVDVSEGGFLIVATVVLSISFAFLLLMGPDQYLLSAALGIGIGAALLHPVAAMGFFVSLLFLRPWEFLPQEPVLKVLPRLTAALTAGRWLVERLRSGRSGLVVNTSSVLFLLFIAWIPFSTFFSTTPGASLRYFFESFSPTSVLVFLILNSLNRMKDVRAFLRVFITSGVGIMIVAFYITCRDYASGASDFRLHSMGLWGNSNDLAALAVLMLPLAISALRRSEPIGYRVMAVLTVLVFLAGLMWSQSRAAQGAALLAGLAYFLFCGARKGVGLFVVPIVVGVAVTVAAAMPQRELADTTGSSESRYNYVIAGLRMARAHPLFGVGVGNYPYLYEQYTPAFIESGNRTAHSTWILALSETGITGLLLLWALYGSVVAHAWSLRVIAPHYLLSMITYGVAMSFLSHTYLFLPYVFLAVIIASYRVSLPSALRIVERKKSHRRGFRVAPRIMALIAVLALLCPKVGYAESLNSFVAQVGMSKPNDGEAPPASQSITLRGSRGEVLSFMVRAEGTGCWPIKVLFDEIVKGAPRLEIVFFVLPNVRTVHPSFPGAKIGSFLDPAVPLRSEGTVCVDPKSGPTWLLGEVRIPKDQPVKPATFRIGVGGKQVTVQVVVWPMTIPEVPTLPAYSELTPWFLVLGHYGAWHQDEARLAQLYSQEMIDHRVVPLKSNIAPLKEQGDAGHRTLDVKTSPSPASSFDSVVLRGRPSWAYYDFPTVGANGASPIDYARAESYFKAVQNTMRSIGDDGRAVVYLWDEPKKAALPELLRLSTMVKRVAPSLKQLVTTPYSPLLESSVDIFSPVMDQFDAPGFPQPSIYQESKRAGHKTWWYVSCMSHGCEALKDSGVPDMVIDRSSSYVRAIGWLSMRYGIDAFLYYSVNNGYQFAPKRDPWESLWDFSGNGDGTLFYPGRPGEHGLSAHQPIASLRLKLWRESSLDAEYIRWMNELPNPPSWWREEFDSVAHSTTSWSRDYFRFQRLRDRAGEYLSELNWRKVK